MATALFVGSFVLSAGLTAIVRRRAVDMNFVARPAADRYHRTVIPLGGGIAIFGTMVFFILAGAAVMKFVLMPGYFPRIAERANIVPGDFAGKAAELVVMLCVAAALFALGLWDDIKHLGPRLKLIVQFAAALAAAFFGEIRVEFFIESRLVTSVFSAFWIVLIINAFNFLDNMDGLSAGIAVIASSILFTAAAMSGQIFVGGLAITFIGALCGFLIFNFPPARIFMGDAGSMVVGFFVAMLTLRTTYYHEALSGKWYPVFMPLIVMAVPLYDFISVTLLRISQGRSPFVGDTQHFSHRLRRRGLSDRQTALTLYLATLCTGLGAIFLYQVDLAGAILIFLHTVMVLSIIAILETTSNNAKKAE